MEATDLGQRHLEKGHSLFYIICFDWHLIHPVFLHRYVDRYIGEKEIKTITHMLCKILLTSSLNKFHFDKTSSSQLTIPTSKKKNLFKLIHGTRLLWLR